MGSELGLTDEQLMGVVRVDRAPADGLFDQRTNVALRYADAMTTGDVSDELFNLVQVHFRTEEIVELTAVIAWENASARFNRALRVESQGLWS